MTIHLNEWQREVVNTVNEGAVGVIRHKPCRRIGATTLGGYIMVNSHKSIYIAPTRAQLDVAYDMFISHFLAEDGIYVTRSTREPFIAIEYTHYGVDACAHFVVQDDNNMHGRPIYDCAIYDETDTMRGPGTIRSHIKYWFKGVSRAPYSDMEFAERDSELSFAY